MRKIADLVSLAALGVVAFIAINAFYGPRRLPARIPTHFDLAGHVNGWGSPATLLYMPVIALGLYLLLAIVSRFPSAFNYPVRVTDQNRKQLEALALDLLSLTRAEMLVFFAWMEFSMVEAARSPEPVFKLYPVVVFVAVLLGTVIGYFAAMFRAAKAGP